MSKLCAGLGLLLVMSMPFAIQAGAQQSATVEKEQKTKLEAFQGKPGTIIIKGYSDISRISTQFGAVEVAAIEFTDAATGIKQMGVAIDITQSGEAHRSFIDYDEVESLLKGIDYISKATKDITKLDSFEAVYTTNDYFQVSTHNSSTGIGAAVNSGYVGAAKVYIALEQLDRLRSLISRAKEKLDSVK